MSKVGAYLPGVHEEVLDIVNAFILTDKVIHLSAPVVAELQHVIWAQMILGLRLCVILTIDKISI